MSASPATTERLYRLMPAFYRRRDFERGEPLRALLGITERELRAVEEDLAKLYENWFIETCEEGVVPSIAKLLGVRGMVEGQHVALSQRAYVANTMRYRRRKGTLAALEAAARDATGWVTHAVEFFELLASTQHRDHVRRGLGGTFDVRSAESSGTPGDPFETAAHTVEVRRIASGGGRYNVPNLGIFLWRLPSYGISAGCARALTDPPDGRFHVHPLGIDMPLFTRPRPRSGFAHAASEVDVPGPLSPRAVARHPDAYYGPERSFYLHRDGDHGRFDVALRDLGDWERPPAGEVAVDVERGRIAFAEGEGPTTEPLRTSYHYGFNADVGGGPYDRRERLADPEGSTWHTTVGDGGRADTLQQALEQWQGELARRCEQRDPPPAGVVRILDSGTYPVGGVLDLPAETTLIIEAADGVRPAVVGRLRVNGPPDGWAALRLNGLLMAPGLEVAGGFDLTVEHCTLRPDDSDASVLLAAEDSPAVSVVVRHSILGPIRLAAGSRSLVIEDSIVDAPRINGGLPAIAADDAGTLPGPPLEVRRSTILGPVFIREFIVASEVIFAAEVRVLRRQSGGVRFSYVPEGSETPRRFRCQPDLALAAGAGSGGEEIVRARVKPRFTSVRYGAAGFAQLAVDCPPEIRTGAEDGSEMGVFSQVKEPQRIAGLRSVLDEYLPVELEAGILRVT